MTDTPKRYSSHDDNNERWIGFEHRPGDIVISTRSKTGTTWLQMICALLIFERSELPAPLPQLSPWLDWLVEPIENVVARLDAQNHRRFIKTHTPLDGLPLHPDVTYIVTGRHPLDVAVSMHAHIANIDYAVLQRLLGNSEPTSRRELPSVTEWLQAWINWDGAPEESLDSFPGLVHHVADAFARSATHDVYLVHYADLAADLEGEMRRLAHHLRLDIAEDRWPSLVKAAEFASMRSRAADLAPAPDGVFRDRAEFFRRGSSGAWKNYVDEEMESRYRDRLATLATPPVASWLDRP